LPKASEKGSGAITFKIDESLYHGICEIDENGEEVKKDKIDFMEI
jgi:hypothetical protein